MAVYRVTFYGDNGDGILKRVASVSFVAPWDPSVPQLRSIALKEAADIPIAWHVGIVEALDYKDHAVVDEFGFLHDDSH